MFGLTLIEEREFTWVTDTTTWHLDDPDGPPVVFDWLPDCDPPPVPADRGICMWNWGFIAVVSRISIYYINQNFDKSKRLD